MGWFVTIEDDEADEVPAEAASEDIDTAAKAARERAEAGPVGHETGGKKVADYVEDPYAGSIDEEALAGATPDLANEEQTFDEVYGAAGLEPANSSRFTIFKVEKLLQSQHLQGLPEKTKASSVLVALEANNVKLNAIIQDAVSRDKALDEYDKMLKRDIKNLESDIEIKNAEIEAEIEDFLQRKKEQIANNNQQLEQARELYATWNLRKQQEEERLFEAVSPFVDQNPITRGNDE
jgi:hypothetical protein